ncbi:DUF6053 domain-containing protein [Lysobacter enzymogenes]
MGGPSGPTLLCQIAADLTGKHRD